MASSRRDHLVDIALKLFSKHGFHATGIDTVLAESGVAKKTLYNHFKSKDELIIAALQKRDEDFLSMMREAVPRLAAQQEGDPRLARIMGFLDAINEWMQSDGFFGCTFINASAEFPRKEDPIHVACSSHKKLVMQFIQELLSELEFENSYYVAKQIAILVDGAIVNVHTACDKEAGKVAKVAANSLLQTYLK